jgi:hypothetical protein
LTVAAIKVVASSQAPAMPSKSSPARNPSQRDLIFAEAPGLAASEFLFDTIGDVLFCVKDRNRRYVAANEAFIRRAGLIHRNELLLTVA